jgi:MarR family transcriptional regulator for hemolysin
MIGKNNNSLGALLHDVAHLLRTTIDREVEPYNLTRAKWQALGVLDRKEGVTQSELAKELELGVATVGRLVERLEARRFIERRPDPIDARVKRLFIRDQARPELDELEEVATSVRKSALRGINKSEQAELVRLLRKMKQNLSALLCFVSLTWCSRVSSEVAILCA